MPTDPDLCVTCGEPKGSAFHDERMQGGHEFKPPEPYTGPTSKELNLAVGLLAVARNHLILSRQIISELEDKLRLDNADAYEALSNFRAEAETAEANLRNLATMAYDHMRPKVKNLCPGVEIYHKSTLTYDPEVMKIWAMERNLPGLLMLNVRAFEQAAPGLRPDGVEITYAPAARIARDLNFALQEGS